MIGKVINRKLHDGVKYYLIVDKFLNAIGGSYVVDFYILLGTDGKLFAVKVSEVVYNYNIQIAAKTYAEYNEFIKYYSPLEK